MPKFRPVTERTLFPQKTNTGRLTFLWTGYAASPRLLRYRIGLSHPSFSFSRSSL